MNIQNTTLKKSGVARFHRWYQNKIDKKSFPFEHQMQLAAIKSFRECFRDNRPLTYYVDGHLSYYVDGQYTKSGEIEAFVIHVSDIQTKEIPNILMEGDPIFLDDTVYCFKNGYGSVFAINDDGDFPIVVEFQEANFVEYNLEFSSTYGGERTLFWKRPTIIPPKK